MTSSDEPPTSLAVLRRRRRRRGLACGVTVAVLATGGAVAFTRLTPRSAASTTTAVTPPATVIVRRADLVDRVEIDGILGYGPASALVGRRQGILTWLPAPAAVINRGERLYAADALPVPLFLGDAPMYRALSQGVPAGPDVAVLQRNLTALGYQVAADGTFGAATTRALRKWQKAIGIPVNGTLEPGDVVVLPAPVRVDSVTAQLAAPATGPVLKLTSTQRVVTLQLEESQRDFARTGAKVDVELADRSSTQSRSSTQGTVRSVTSTSDDSGKAPKLAVTVALDDASVAGGADAGPVTVRLPGTARPGVLAVPVEALLALREGGYALEILDGDQHRLVAVKLGMFADGLVEVSGTELTDGVRVVTAA